MEEFIPVHPFPFFSSLISSIPFLITIFSSFHELMQSRGVRRPSSVRLSVNFFCANRYFYHRSGWIATKLAHDGPQMGLHPGYAQGQDQGQRSRDTDTFLITRKSLLLSQTWLDRHKPAHDGPTWDYIQGVLKVKLKVKGHVIRTLLWFHENRFFSQTNDWIATMVPIRARIQDVLKVKVKRKGHMIRTLLWCHEMFAIQYRLTFFLYMHSLCEAPLRSSSCISVRQLQCRCIVYIMEWATPSLTVWFPYSVIGRLSECCKLSQWTWTMDVCTEISTCGVRCTLDATAK